MRGIPYLMEFLEVGNEAHLRGQKTCLTDYIYVYYYTEYPWVRMLSVH